ncbi:NAD(P)H-dependent oxidoreductase [Microbacterium lacticum]
MPRTLVVVAHPDLRQSRVNAAWVRALRADGRASVHVLADPGTPGLVLDVDAEKALLESNTRIVLQFPFHWYSAPAILHSWLDQVLQRGWAYGPGGDALSGKELALAVSTWSTREDYTTTGRYRRTIEELTSPYEVTARRTGMRYLSAHVLNGVGRVTDDELAANAQALVAWANAERLPDGRLSPPL